MILLAHPTGNTFFRAAARALHAQGWLQELHSCICWDQHLLHSHLLPAAIAAQLSRRSYPDVPLSLQYSHPWREVARLLTPALPLVKRHEIGPLSVDAVYRSFDRHVAARLPKVLGLRAVYAYEDGALSTFQAAKALRLRCLYELPIGYWKSARHIFAEEAELQPHWANTLTGLGDSASKMARKDAELAHADAVIVATQFVRHTLESHQACSVPIHVLPYGAPPPTTHPLRGPTSGPLRVLFVGSLGQRKGLSYLL